MITSQIITSVSLRDKVTHKKKHSSYHKRSNVTNNGTQSLRRQYTTLYNLESRLGSSLPFHPQKMSRDFALHCSGCICMRSLGYSFFIRKQRSLSMAAGPCSSSYMGGKLNRPVRPHIKITKQNEENRVCAMFILQPSYLMHFNS